MQWLTDICRQRRDVPITAVCSAPILKIKDSRNLPKDFSSGCGWFHADYDTLMKTAELSPVMSQLIAHRKSCFDHCRIRMKTSEFFRSANYPYPSNKKAVRRIKSGKRPFQYALVPGGRLDYPHARRLLLAADCGGSNGYNRRMFKKYPADFAMEAGLEINVCHYPPGCSKYNKIERRLFSQISISMHGRPLTSVSVFQKLIEHTPTSAGLTVQCVLDENVCLKGRKISDKRFAALPVIHDGHLGDWNYVISSLHR